jgi:asparagine synthase (glutamine-hydrolysing)
MCGIAGIWRTKETQSISSDLKKMTDSIDYRGPDGEGHWIDESHTIGFGHRRLSIIDLSINGHQPMFLEDRYVITFNGEIYNYIELRAELIQKGYTFKTNSDTEVLMVAYHEWGEKCLSKLDGMFSFAIYDKSNKELFCARDRFGEKPFYYYQDDEFFAFGSEMKELFSIGIQKKIDLEMLFLYLNYDVVENPHDKSQTFYENLIQLPASSYLKINSDRKITVSQYWTLDTTNKTEYSESDATERFRELFDESIKRRMRSDVPTGASLSGGVDSSAIVCSIASMFPDAPFRTFTARFDDANYDEGHFIEKLKEQYDLDTIYCHPSPDQIKNELDLIFHHQEEPFGSTSILAQWEVMKLARANGTTVLLDGQGADETLGGYFKYFTPFLSETKSNRKRDFKSQLKAIENHLDSGPFLSKKDKLRMLSPGLFDQVANTSRKYRSNSYSGDLQPDFVRKYKNHPSPFHQDNNLNSFLHNDVFKYGLGKLLRFSDRNAMAHSIEVRLPYLSHELVEFAFSLDTKFKIWDGWTKLILRKSMENRVPNDILYRKDKKGFQAPKSWLEQRESIDIIDASFKTLKENGIVTEQIKSNHWKYIMAAKLMKNG